MRLREAAASALHLLVVLSYFALGAFAVLLLRRPDWNKMATDLLVSQSEIFYWVGAALGAIGLFFLLGFFGIGRGKYLRLSMQEGKAVIHSKIIRQAIEECFKLNYPEQVLGASVTVVKGQRLEVAIDVTALDEEEQLTLLADSEAKLLHILKSRFGYSQPLTLFVCSR
jgi:hypothetical protein